MKERISNLKLRSRITNPEEASMSIKNGMTVAMGGYAYCGYPKVIAAELVKRKEAGEDLKINLITGANVGPEIDDALGNANIVNRRMPMQESKVLAKLINQGKVSYAEQQMNKMPNLIQHEIYGKIDVAVIEALALTKDGGIILTSSVGMVPHFINMAENIIVEINLAQPVELDGIHDIFLPFFPPDRKPIPLLYTNQRIGDPYIQVEPEKIKSIIESNIPDTTVELAESNNQIRKISENLLNFLEIEVRNRLNGNLPPIQNGFGNLANGIVNAFKDSNFKNIEFFCGGLQEANIELITSGKLKAASAGAMQMTPRVINLIKQYPDELKKIVVLRNTDLTNNAETINRLGVIALNSAIEVDIYGNANSSHIMGTHVVNGIGGGANFAQNSYLSIMLLPSVTKDGAISTIVPMVTHNDINEHDIDVIITENGIADLRGKDDIERAICIINNCSSSIYKDQMSRYLEKAIMQVGGHHPQLLPEAFSWHLRLKDTGTMKEAAI